MGQRANLIIVECGEYMLYYDHWCANRLDSYLFWGVEKAARFFRDHENQGEDWWLDDVWCEGGAVIDLDKKILLWFGGEEICYDISLRRLFLELMLKNWQDFQIQWAHEGIADLADYVGYSREKVLAPFDDEEIFDSKKISNIFNPAEKHKYWESMVSIRNPNNGIELYPACFMANLQELLFYGSSMLNKRRRIFKKKYLKEYTDNPDGDNPLNAGVHIDIPRKELHIWTCQNEILDFKRLQQAWDGYKIYYHKDSFEIQAKLTDNKLRFTERNNNDMLNKIKHIVCIDTTDPLKTLNSMTTALAERGEDVQVSSAAYIASPFESDKSSLEELFDRLFICNK